MRRKILRLALIVGVPALVAGMVAFVALDKKWSRRLGFGKRVDWATATTLTFEVDVERTKKRMAAEDADLVQWGAAARTYAPPDMQELADLVRRRIDPDEEKDILVRPVGENRIEVLVAPVDGGKTADDQTVADVRWLLGRPGVLEFRILANMDDDRGGIEAAQRIFDAPTDAEKAENDKLATAGLPPLPPPGFFPVRTRERADEVDSAYRWVRLSPEEEDSLRLSPRYANPETAPVRMPDEDPAWATAFYREVEATRGKTFIHNGSSFSEGRRGYSYLLFSRNAGRAVEYFVLTRVSTADTMKISGRVRMSAWRDESPDSLPAVGFQLNAAGASEFGDLTERNRPSESLIRNLAIILDEQVISAPTLNAVLRDQGQISGNFTEAAARRLAKLMNSGSLPVELKPVPEPTK